MKERQKATDQQQAQYTELYRTQSKAIWRKRLEIFRDVFPWITEEIKAFAGLAKNDPLESQESQLKFITSHGDYMNGTMASDPRLADLHRRQNREWTALTGLPPLGHHTEWRAAALASGANVGESLSLADYNRVAESIKSWAIARRANESTRGGYPNGDDEKETEGTFGTADERMLVLLDADPRRREFTAKEWAELLDVNERTVRRLATWKALQSAKEEAKKSLREKRT
ncbi:hypothetical protein FF011L_06350 [Roseimaritima multifibrata]|uniref:Uncharacterized protein n=1 Tax=Roseimaritima multifibrata TaxID=1930274 RepID=A0A517MAI0_9BACT|nr:hypothetical protein [Roseimaritima multifibrata]QDS91899.1 hypothetical protein FF011L_06350 [Roseimaritima multifibrata]